MVRKELAVDSPALLSLTRQLVEQDGVSTPSVYLHLRDEATPAYSHLPPRGLQEMWKVSVGSGVTRATDLFQGFSLESKCALVIA